MSALPAPPRRPPPPADGPGAPGAVLALRAVSKSFPGVRALHAVSFDVGAGEVHALLGENGAGKSTLIKIISGVYPPDEGQLVVHGRAVRFAGPREAQAEGIATIYQEFSLYPQLSVAENIFSGHLPRGRLGGTLDWQAAQREAARLLASLDAADIDVRARAGALSVGNRQRVEIAKALSRQARILILDEPTAVLTQHDADRLFAVVRRLRDQGVAVVYISHRLDEIFALASRVTVLRDGELVGTRPVAATSEGELIRMMVGRALAQEPAGPAPGGGGGGGGEGGEGGGGNSGNGSEGGAGRVVLRAENLARRPLLRGASLELRAGEIVGLAGLIGSGRSELAQALFGVAPAESGRLEVDGRPVTLRRAADGIRLGIAYVPEDRQRQGLVLPMNVRENIGLTRFWRLRRGPFVDVPAEERLAAGYVRSLRIKTPHTRQLVRNLSGGNQQKIVLAKWLANQPRILIVDEPTRGIDVGARAEIHRLLVELAGQGLAVLVISSDLAEVLRLSHRVVVMHGGRVAAVLSRAQATQEAVLTAALGQPDPAPSGSPAAAAAARD